MRVQGWDPLLIICQIISLQTIHYLTLSTLLPPFLTTLTSPDILIYSGGPSTVSHVMDWREMAARPTVNKGTFPGVEGWRKLRGAWAGGKWIGKVKQKGESEAKGVKEEEEKEEMWDYGVDKKRGWVIAGTWMLAFAIDILPLYYIIRRPTHILDFALTLIFNHFILTTYYSASFPTSIFYWLVQACGAVLMVVSAEALCVRREMKSALEIGWSPDAEAGLPLFEEQPDVTGDISSGPQTGPNTNSVKQPEPAEPAEEIELHELQERR
ncbi:hypothetical protein C343_05857 [Cryptococcus neoformans C23]|uniref:Integral membrane protein n=2 Tax=Cryptococcus neoformans TaxID=5207 RepID=A0A854Q3P8_CRYNE|nr:hypothetical protein CNAG_01504 [Cryptococcus neoformans var. grubii H99]AUB27764.1 hypothetical protein CKF44_01504 [Cryptococcus neoformans var. grubii]OWT36197.1 hypothetical protein C362_05892 [Cryptococcus neoformans var. grubii Bt1]OWZ27472.1 hypothetical protein C347_05896 [Cryptococcus neoformans var. grubii AD2-60a]OWZ32799.1 hypothetical protein C353_05757 [Cryptococcus neoformans var. grubii AD1-83a]OWZ39776.1 hypothetical protein C343_05857 [Cryptococcus neoformans var. grubii C|eukprot:XP_012052567.1 hypothetical protein CNAG_01504 [Cryptococcus neoformans var. grubii H99]